MDWDANIKRSNDEVLSLLRQIRVEEARLAAACTRRARVLLIQCITAATLGGLLVKVLMS